jgi:hypothetical protein
MYPREDLSKDRSRIAGGVALGAGLAFVTGEVLSRAWPDTDFVACATGAAYLINLVDLLKYGLMGVALLLLVRMLGDGLSRLGRVVGLVAAVGLVVTGVANGIEHCAHMDSLGLVYVLGVLIGLLGGAVFGVFLARSGTLPTWMGWAISVGVLGFLARAEEGGAVLLGIAWIAIGVRLLTHPKATARDPATTKPVEG